MTYMEFNVDGLKEMKDFFHGLQKPPLKMIASLEKELAGAFAATQAATHIITGSLKASGKTSSDFSPAAAQWEGEITYGGASLGPINPVDYAIYEQARGGAHDFMAPVKPYEDRITEIMENWTKYV